MAEREEGADGHGRLSCGDEPPGHEVDAGNVVRIKGVTEAKDPGYCGGADKLRMLLKDHTRHDPGNTLGEDQQGDDGDGAEGQTAQDRRSGVDGMELLR